MEKRVRKRDLAGGLDDVKQTKIAELIKQSVGDTQPKLFPRGNNDDQFPLTSAQLRLWYAWKLDPQDRAYNLAGSLFFTGHIEASLVERSFHLLLQKHGALNLYFHEKKGEVMQQLRNETVFEFSVSHAIAEHASVAENTKRAFDLQTDPLLRVSLLIGEEKTELLIVVHHIATDGTSMQILFDQFIDTYCQLKAGVVIPERVKQVDFLDYAHWYNTTRDKSIEEQQLQAWKKHLPEQIDKLALPAHEQSRSASGYDMGTYTSVLNVTDWSNVKATANLFGTTPYVVLLTVFQMLLSRYSSQGVIPVGIPVANRHLPETLGLVGFFVNTQVNCLRVSQHDTFATLLAQGKNAFSFAQTQQDVPFERLVDALQVERMTGVHPLFQIMFNYLRRDRRQAKKLTHAALSETRAHRFSMPFDLHLDVIEELDALVALNLYFAKELYCESFIAQFQADFLHALSNLNNESQTNSAEGALWRTVYNESFIDKGICIEVKQSLLGQLRSFAHHQPDKVAVKADHFYTFNELESQSNRLANWLKQQKIVAGDKVGIRWQRDIDLLTVLLAVMKVGAVYVPIDPKQPQERQAYIVRASNIKMILTNLDFSEPLCVSHYLPSVVLHEHSAFFATEIPNPDALAYILYTSGSTGNPKGVAVTWRGLHNYLAAVASEYMSQSEQSFVSSTLSFDATVTSLLLPLWCGKTVELMMAADNDLSAIAKHISSTTVNCLYKLTPAHLDGLKRTDCSYASLRQHYFVIGGDKLLSETVASLQKHLPNSTFINEYGPTETVVGCSVFYVNETSIQDYVVQPISNAIANTQLYVLDKYLNPCPRHALGELYIAGDGVAQGYDGRASLSAERFIADPFKNDGSRMYRSGDLVRVDAQGQLLFIGRVDDQVKIRGFRIELGEIESQLLHAPDVKEAVVVVNQTATGPKLVAYVTGHGCESQVIEAYLAERLLDYMLPSAVMVLSILPLTVNGKIDKKQLPKPEYQQATLAFSAPISEQEKLIAAIWQPLLNVVMVGREDNFFKLGGDSILALRFIAQLNQALNADFPLKILFEHTSLKNLAVAITAPKASNRLALIKVKQDVKLVASPSQQSLWVAHQLAWEQNQADSYNIFGAVDLHGNPSLAKLQQALDKIVARHITLRTAFFEHENQLKVNVVSDYSICVEELDFRGLTQSERDDQLQELQLRFAKHQFDLSTLPLLKFTAVWLANDQLRVLINMHHIICDGWSIAILIKELSQFYAGSSDEQVSVLEFDYLDYALWQQQRRISEEAQAEQQYWKTLLSDPPLTSLLPLHKPWTSAVDSTGEAVEFQFTRDDSAKLSAFAKQHGISLNTILLTSYLLFLQSITRQKDVIIGVDLAGREHHALEAQIGYFVKVLPVRTSLSGEITFIDSLNQVNQALMNTFDNQLFTLDDLMKQLNPSRSQYHSPLLQQLFVMQNTPKSRWEVDEVSFTPVKLDVPIHSKFANALFITPDEHIHCNWVYRQGLYAQQVMQTWLISWAGLTLDLVTDPDKNVQYFLETVRKADSARTPKRQKFQRQGTNN